MGLCITQLPQDLVLKLTPLSVVEVSPTGGQSLSDLAESHNLSLIAALLSHTMAEQNL